LATPVPNSKKAAVAKTSTFFITYRFNVI
jgi:hypothetical protein